ncbi:MAG: septal ring lytic transglycosylase RlpA family protein [Synechococcaceae cyanobacterium SM2_3_2]|nr:septal ring lytic transglycosylase RlpA family protein [Synechococcaceae cyanobacterium SM2_3_2]
MGVNRTLGQSLLLAGWLSAVVAATDVVSPSQKTQSTPLLTPSPALLRPNQSLLPAPLPETGSLPAPGLQVPEWTQDSDSLTLKRGSTEATAQPHEVASATALQASLPDPGAVEVLKLGEFAPEEARADLPLSTLYSYTIDGQEAATVYVRDLPIISFVAQDPDQPSPLDRATDLTSHLNQLAQQAPDQANITVDWVEAETDSSAVASHYLIKIDDDVLLEVGDGVLLAPGTENHASAALMAANRLRRLLFDAPPLSSVPQPPQPLQAEPVALENEGSLEPTLQAQTQSSSPVATEQGIASFYHHPQTSQALTAAHRTLPFGTRVRVINIENGAEAVVEINDRGPFIPGRVIDVSIAAAQALRMIQMGVAPVRVEVLD